MDRLDVAPLGTLMRAKCQYFVSTTIKYRENPNKKLVRAAGVEPTTYGFGGRHSIQLSYARTSLMTPDGGYALFKRSGKQIRPDSKSADRQNRDW